MLLPLLLRLLLLLLLQVTYAKGWGTIKGPNEVEVSLLDGSKQTISAKNILIATGSEVTPLPGVPVDEER
jgi:dihydrolipoamide dehydrogenase